MYIYIHIYIYMYIVSCGCFPLVEMGPFFGHLQTVRSWVPEPMLLCKRTNIWKPAAVSNGDSGDEKTHEFREAIHHWSGEISWENRLDSETEVSESWQWSNASTEILSLWLVLQPIPWDAKFMEDLTLAKTPQWIQNVIRSTMQVEKLPAIQAIQCLCLWYYNEYDHDLIR